MIVAAIVDSTGFNHADKQGNIVQLIVFIAILLICIIPAL
jgi:hypothetical protein